MHVQQVDVISLKLLEGCLERNAEGLCAVTSIVDTLARRVVWIGEASGELGGYDHLVSYASLLHPLTDPRLGLLVLVVVCAVLVSASVVERCCFHVKHCSSIGAGKVQGLTCR